MKNNHDNVSVVDAAQMMGVSPSYIRMGIRSGRLPFGTAVKMSSKWTYHISRPALTAYLQNGVTVKSGRESA